jgi:hypothetical protein
MDSKNVSKKSLKFNTAALWLIKNQSNAQAGAQRRSRALSRELTNLSQFVPPKAHEGDFNHLRI